MPWLTGGAPGPIGVRVPEHAVELPPIAATSANPAGAPVATSVDEVALELRPHVACAIDRGPIGDAASTILDLVAWEATGDAGGIRVIRDEAGRAARALELLAAIRR